MILRFLLLKIIHLYLDLINNDHFFKKLILIGLLYNYFPLNMINSFYLAWVDISVIEQNVITVQSLIVLVENVQQAVVSVLNIQKVHTTVNFVNYEIL